MAIIDLVKFTAPSDESIVEKFISEHEDELRIGTQIVVNQSQEAILVKGGVALDAFGPGTHTITTGNIPLLRRVVNTVFGKRTPFTAEVWYVNRTSKRDLQWGTPKRVAVMDPKFDFPISVGAFGQWGFRVSDSRSFVTQLVGSQIGADSHRVYQYFIGEIIEKVSQNIVRSLASGHSITTISTRLTDLSRETFIDLSAEFSRFGIELVNFSISSINITPDELARIQDVMAKRMEMNILGSTPVGQGFITSKSLEIMKDSANNESAAGCLVAAGTGLGLGIGAALPAAQQIGQSMSLSPDSAVAGVAARLAELRNLLDSGIITQAEFDAIRAKILESI